jgi:hypothetical protein
VRLYGSDGIVVQRVNSIHQVVFASALNRLHSVAEIERGLLAKIPKLAQPKITCVVMACGDRLAAMLEGASEDIVPLWADIQRSRFLRRTQLLMQDSKAKAALYPQHKFMWRNCDATLEIACFVSDMRRHCARTALWLADPCQVAQLLEPDK